MSDTPDLEALLATGRPRSRGGGFRRFSPEVAAARKVEQTRRASAAQNWARQALTKLHPDAYSALYEQAIAKVNAERGPLPGDEVAS